MNRRSWLRLVTLAGAAGILPRGRRAQAADAAAAPRPIVLYCDLPVDPAREQEMLDAYHTHFKPVAERHEGYIDLKIVKAAQGDSGRAGAGAQHQLPIPTHVPERGAASEMDCLGGPRDQLATH